MRAHAHPVADLDAALGCGAHPHGHADDFVAYADGVVCRGLFGGKRLSEEGEKW